MKSISEIEAMLEDELGQRENYVRATFVELRRRGKATGDVDTLTNAVTEIRCLKNTIKTLKKGG